MKTVRAVPRLIVSTSIVASIAALPALAVAQTAEPAQTTGTTTTAPAPGTGAVAAPMTATDDNRIGEIIVTAQRRQEALSKVPVAATVLSGESFERSGSIDIEDLKKISPSLTFDSTTSDRNNSVRIRGVGTNTTSSGTEPSTSTIFDEVVLVRQGQSSTLSLGDIERFEVLRGPQGTLFGKNASVGAINISTRRPSFDTEAAVELGLSSDDETIVKAAVNGGLTENIAGRFAFFVRDWAGNIDNVATGGKLNGQNAIGMRGRLLFQPDPDTDITLSINYGRKNSNCCARPLFGLSNATTPAALEEARRLLPIIPFIGNNRVLVDTISKDNSKSVLPYLTINRRFGDFTLTSVTSYQYFEIDQLVEDDQTATNPFVVSPCPAPFTLAQCTSGTKQEITSLEEIKAFTQELRLASPRWDWGDFVAGLYFFRADIDQISTNRLRDIAAGAVRRRDSTFVSETDLLNYAAFGQLNVRPTDGLTVFGGLRYTYDKADNLYTRDDATVAFRNGDITYARTATARNVSGKAGLSYQATPNVFLYGSYTRGYKGPGFNVASNGGDTVAGVVRPDTTLRPELSDSFELGAKLVLFDRRLTLNLAAFKARYSDFVINSFDVSTNTVRLLNAAVVRTKGLEADIVALPFPGLSLSGSIAYIKGEFDVNDTFCFSGQTVAQGCVGGRQNIVGGDLPNSPDLKYNIAATYTLKPADSPVDLSFTADYRWQERAQTSIDQAPFSFNPAFGIANVSLAATTKDGKYRAEIYVKNVFDKFYANGLSATAFSGFQTYFLSREASRYAGIRLVAKY